MKILLVSQYYYPERFSTTDIAKTLVRMGHSVSVITGKPNYGFGHILPEYKNIKYEVIDGVEIFRVGLLPRKKDHFSISLNYLSFHFNAKRLVRHLKKEFDIVLSVSLSPVISIAPACLYSKKHKIPHVLYCQDLWPESTVVTGAVKLNSLAYKILYRWSRSLYEKCDKIIVSSPSFISYFKDVLKLENKHFEVINQPSLLPSYSIEPIIYTKKHNFVYAGNIGHLQLINELVDAFKHINDENVCLHIMGMGSELEAIKKRIKEENLESFITYEGALPLEKAESYFKNADALIVSLKSGGTVGKTIPNKAIQYMSYGKPILGIVKGDAYDLLNSAKGTIFADEDGFSIASSINKFVMMSEQEKKKLGDNNLSYYRENLTNEKLISSLEKVLVESLNNR